MTEFSSIRLDSIGTVATVTLNRPEQHNAYNVTMRDELFQAFAYCREDADLEVVVLRGAGRSFCAGADLSEFGTAPSPFLARRIRFGRDVWAALRSISSVVIAVMHGHVIGTGLEMALQCDIRIADRTMRASMPEAALGLVPAAGGTQLTPHEAPSRLAAELLFTGRVVQADEARSLGLVHRVCSPEARDAEVAALVDRLLLAPAGANRLAKRLLRLDDRLPAAAAVAHERSLAGSFMDAR